MAVAVVLGCTLTAAAPGLPAAAQPATCANPVACENALPGTPPSRWQVGKGEGGTIQGFADPFSADLGQSISFKIQSPATAYGIQVYRMGWYGGDGARLEANLTPDITVSQTQPPCNANPATGLIDCGNWGVSATWNIPATAVSGVYFARIYRTDGSTDENQIPFVVTNDASHSDIVDLTSDETWQAYNDWGGDSLYTGNATDTAHSPLDPGRAEQVSYNRPFATRFDTPGGQDYFFATEFPMIQFLEKNGYDVSYVSQSDVSAPGAASMLEQHKVLLNAGHSEYWDAGDRANVTAARDAGVSLAFFAGNLMWWKTRWAASQYGGEADRTLITYKESLDSAETDPAGPSTWTGAWRDPRFSPPGDGGQPENALTGQLWMVNCCSYALQVPSAYSQLRFWRNTSVASLAAGQTATMPGETLGYEWDSDVDNGFRPAGEIDMSMTTQNVQQRLMAANEVFASGPASNSLTLYRAASGALVFDTGSVQWAWGLESQHDGDAKNPPSPAMQQATVNLLADMGAQPTTLESGLTPASASTDTIPPTSAITSPSAGTTLANGATVTVTGTATDAGGGVVAGVEVSTDGGSTWHPATTISPAETSVTWSYTWSAAGAGPVTILSRGTDDSGNIEMPGPGVPVTVSCPCGLFGSNYTPAVTSANDPAALEVGMKFQADVPGWVAGVRFYKGAGNVGTHTGSLWTSAGVRLATGTFTSETASGWQTLVFARPVQISASATYVVSYFDPTGHYADDLDLFDWPLNTAPLTAPQSVHTSAGGNGVFNPGGPGFPASTFHGSSYGVDVIFDPTQPAGAAPMVTTVTPYPGSSSFPVSAAPAVTFSKPVVPGTASFTLTDPGGAPVPGTASLDTANTVATFTPTSPLAPDTTYTATISGAADSFGQAMLPATYTYTFTTSRSYPAGQCPCVIWPDVPPPGAVDAADAAAIDLGVKFKASSNGVVAGIRFYKEPDNTGAHAGSLWSSTGILLATGTFASESTAGWQELDFATPVPVTAGLTYVASYSAGGGHYASTQGSLSAPATSGPLTVPVNGGVYGYGPATTFPSRTFAGSNYWVDVVYSPSTDPVGPMVTSTTPQGGQASVPAGTAISFSFDKPVRGNTIQFSLSGPGSLSVPGTLNFDSSTSTATFIPTSTIMGTPALAPDTTYTATVSGAQNSSGTLMSSPDTWSFTTAQAAPPAGQCPCSIWPDSTQPPVPSAKDAHAVNVGVKFTSDSGGWISGIRFYKGAANSGTHVGSLWTASGTLLGQVTFAGESTTGWQQADFSSPIRIIAGATYIASYFAPNGGYAVMPATFSGRGVDNPPLHALPSAAGAGNGVYLYGGAPQFPTITFNASNYWVDVVFTTEGTL